MWKVWERRTIRLFYAHSFLPDQLVDISSVLGPHNMKDLDAFTPRKLSFLQLQSATEQLSQEWMGLCIQHCVRI